MLLKFKQGNNVVAVAKKIYVVYKPCADENGL